MGAVRLDLDIRGIDRDCAGIAGRYRAADQHTRRAEIADLIGVEEQIIRVGDDRLLRAVLEQRKLIGGNNQDV